MVYIVYVIFYKKQKQYLLADTFYREAFGLFVH